MEAQGDGTLTPHHLILTYLLRVRARAAGSDRRRRARARRSRPPDPVAARPPLQQPVQIACDAVTGIVGDPVLKF